MLSNALGIEKAPKCLSDAVSSRFRDLLVQILQVLADHSSRCFSKVSFARDDLSQEVNVGVKKSNFLLENC